MNAIKMNRLELLNIVRANLEKHKAEYIESVNDHAVAMKLIAAENVKIAKKNANLLHDGATDLSKLLPSKQWLAAPTSYANDYARAIRMLELSVEEVIDVEEDIFNQLVLDEWGWKHKFVAASGLYKTMSGSQ